jgi:ribosomal protein L11 methyltransferase
VLPTPADPAAAYWELTVTLGTDAPETAEAVTNRLWELGAIGVVEETADRAVRLRAFLPPGSDAASRAAAVREYLDDVAALGLPGARARVDVAPLPDEPWAEAWRAHFRPVPVGQRLLVCPPWDAPGPATADGRVVLLERALAGARVPNVLDVGCGSGVLAITAAKLGVARVDAIDLDPDAVAATEDNARRNAVGDRVHASVVAVEAWRGPAAPLVLANLLAAAHVTMAPTLARLIAPAGSLIAGGLLAHEVPAVAGAFTAVGCWLVEMAEHEGWAAILVRRGG